MLFFIDTKLLLVLFFLLHHNYPFNSASDWKVTCPKCDTLTLSNLTLYKSMISAAVLAVLHPLDGSKFISTLLCPYNPGEKLISL